MLYVEACGRLPGNPLTKKIPLNTFNYAVTNVGNSNSRKETCDIFTTIGGTIYLVELEAIIEERLKRNRHPHRLEHKPTTRNIERSKKSLKTSLNKYRLNSEEGDIKEENYIKINNINLTADKVAKIIKEEFNI